MSEKLSAARMGDVEPGDYSAGDDLHFDIDVYGDDKYLLRFAGDPEVFVLYTDRVALGGRELKYDSGAPALLVSAFGGMTLYTDDNPSGLPVVRDGDSVPPQPEQLSLADLESAAQDESEHLAYACRLSLNFTADWKALGGDPNLRAMTFDAMENAARGIERFASTPATHATFSQKVDAVKLVPGYRPTLDLKGKILIVTFNPRRGYTGRASSRAISLALHKLLSVPPFDE